MTLTRIKRVLKGGFVNFWRNGWISFATVLIVVITLFTIGSLIFARAILLSTLSEIQNKVDISVYFKIDAEEADIIMLKDSLSGLEEVKAVEYISREEALESFRERHRDNALIIQSLDEIGENPLGAALNIRAKETSQYANISKFLQDRLDSGGVNSTIDKINYFQNKMVIDRISKILDSAKKIGFGITIALIIISVLVTFNTVRLAIYTSKEEISIMRLVGASSRFVSGPFIVEGMMYGLVSSIVTMFLFYPFVKWLGPLTESFFGGINLHSYYLSNFFEIFFVLLAIGVVLSSISSMIAVRRYLRT